MVLLETIPELHERYRS